MNKPKLSIVSTLYKSERFLEDFLAQSIATLDEIQCNNYEIIFVNDGSPDNSLNFLLEKRKTNPSIIVIDLSRNFGHHYAMQVGLNYSKGEYVFLIDSDLETPPGFLINCYEKMKSNDFIDVVYGYQEERKGKFIESFGGRLFWWILNVFSDVKIPKNILTERLMKRKYVDSLLKLRDANLFLGGMMHWTGYNQKGIPVRKSTRKGKSTYSASKRAQLMIHAITSFSGKPLEYLFKFGILITLGSIVFIGYLLLKKAIYGDEIQLGWTSLVTINVLILGIISTFLGLIGIYIFKIFRQVQNRPNAIIKDIYES